MSFLKHFPYNNILVLGLAKSGTAAAKLLLHEHKRVRINELKPESDTILDELQQMGAELVIGSHPISVIDDIDIIVKTPGISYDHPILLEAMARQIPIITEIEIASLLTTGPIIGITGSNGKTTTTSLIGDMLRADGLQAKVAGNIGVAATETVQSMTPDDHLVLELSSFQLMGTQTFKPKIAVLLNLYEAHLDYHKTFESYVEAKTRIFKNQSADDYLVYNADHAKVKEVVQHAHALCVPFSATVPQKEGAWADENTIYFKEERIMSRSEVALVGHHNLENILAAVAVAKLVGVHNASIKNILMSFTGIRHRLEFVADINGRLYYNDSKATNILAAQKALSAFDKPIIWLAGGLERGQSFDELLPFMKHVKSVVAFGETQQKLIELAQQAGIEHVIPAKDVSEAAIKAHDMSETGDVVLLSPACASWDQYRTFEERGDMFIQAVHRLM
ncbi:UDP-N-acetylmuramoyl-L-alanine--D-glutamate ligase [Lentibacillus saliphilus]|uniref:UDP-N-acetylmuramoyl-L-alanine--D-glutamate ligase n=1 Tax=Lentibacillus saliphilus TaxID=2737028 RepID=UPI001C3113D7|nr:UDP-N-acetylmuramoyl-L-alanine--D-glutamate ligase [Lentibacillus saliphilus]